MFIVLINTCCILINLSQCFIEVYSQLSSFSSLSFGYSRCLFSSELYIFTSNKNSSFFQVTASQDRLPPPPPPPPPLPDCVPLDDPSTLDVTNLYTRKAPQANKQRRNPNRSVLLFINSLSLRAVRISSLDQVFVEGEDEKKFLFFVFEYNIIPLFKNILKHKSIDPLSYFTLYPF